MEFFFDSISRLSDNGYLDDDQIQLKQKLFFLTLEPEKLGKVHCFYPGFYRDRLIQQNQNLSNWTKRVDIFSLDFIFIPVNGNLHWSLCVVIRPLEWMKALYLKNELQEDENELEQEACLLFMDSIGGRYLSRGLHDCKVIGINVAKYLSSVWLSGVGKERSRASKASSTASHARYSESQISDYIDRITNTSQYQLDLASNKCFFCDIPKIYCRSAPKQLNGVDCGIFVYKFIELVVNIFPTSLPQDLDNCFAEWFQNDMITQESVSKERMEFVDLMKGMRVEFLARQQEKPAAVVDPYEPVYVKPAAVVDHYDAVYVNKDPCDEEKCLLKEILEEILKDITNHAVSQLVLPKETMFKNTTTTATDDFVYTLMLSGCMLIREIPTFVDAQFQPPNDHNNNTLLCYDAGTILFGKHNPVILIMFATPPTSYSTTSATSSAASSSPSSPSLSHDLQVSCFNTSFKTIYNNK